MENSSLNKLRKKRQLHHDRIVLDDKSMQIIQNMQNQIQTSMNAVVKIDTRKLVNFLIQSRAPTLSLSDLKLLKEKYFDQVKALEWALQQAKEAKANNSELTISDILKKLETPLVTEKSSRKIPLEAKKKFLGAPLPAAIEGGP